MEVLAAEHGSHQREVLVKERHNHLEKRSVVGYLEEALVMERHKQAVHY